jgi:tetratricopeptide (TPR) repeat protein
MNPKPTTTYKQKILLVIWGIFLTLFILEIGMRIGGAAVLFYQERWNRGVTFSSKEYRILCIGESTTALGGRSSYPAQLEAILNSRKTEKTFKVINKGLVSATTDDILPRLQGYLKQYHPALVICMLGINDKGITNQGNALTLFVDRILEKSRVHHLFEFLKMHIAQKLNLPKGKTQNTTFPAEDSPLDDTSGLTATTPDQLEAMQKSLQEMQILSKKFEAYIPQALQNDSKEGARKALEDAKMNQYQLLVMIAYYYSVRDDDEQAIKYLEQAISLIPDNDMAYTELGRLYKDKKEYKRASELFSKAIILNPNAVTPRLALARCYDTLGLSDKVEEIYVKILAKKLNGFQIYRDIGNWARKNNRFVLAENVLKKAIQENPDDFSLYEWLANVYKHLGNEIDATFYANKSNELRSRNEDYLPITIKNYNEIAEIIASHHAKMIVMQYPLRDIESLKKVFWSNTPIIFVENKTNFEQAVSEARYAKYFTDSFGGVFGHCTPRGNRLIAEHLADVILEQFIK